MTAETSSVNPYAAPDSDLNKVSKDSGIEIFERFSAWGVFGLMLVTLGIYYYVWLYKRTNILNPVVENDISGSFVSATLVLIILSYVGEIGEFLMLDSAYYLTYTTAYTVIGIVATVMSTVWVFKIRNRINQLTKSYRGDKTWCSLVMTFFFSAIYLQYKINQNLDEVKSYQG